MSFKHIWHYDKMILCAFQQDFGGIYGIYEKIVFKNSNLPDFVDQCILFLRISTLTKSADSSFNFSIGHYKCTNQEASVWIIVSVMCLFVRRLQSSFRSFGTLQKLPIREIPFQTHRWRVERSQSHWISDNSACLCQLSHYLNATIKGRNGPTFIASN